MGTQGTLRAKVTKQSPEQSANYFGLIVEVVDAMPNLTLIRYGSREFLVYTEDLKHNEGSCPDL